jgi:DNA-binding NarL/FixJ family response regulator
MIGGAVSTSIQSPPELLSAHEHRIAELAAAGSSNQDIGDDFDVCARTVEHHLTKVYRKLRIAGRNDLRPALRCYSARQDSRRNLYAATYAASVRSSVTSSLEI